MTKKRKIVIMPRMYSPEERKHIEESLHSAAAECLSLYGVRRTTVDEIVSRSHMAKGSFYLFYSSKEELFLSLLDSFILSLEEKYLEMLQNLDENHIVTSLTEVFCKTALLFYREGIFRFLDRENIELIKRKVGDEKFDVVTADAEKTLTSLFSYFSIDDEGDIESFMKAYTAVLSLFLTEGPYEEKESTVRFLIRGLVLQMVE